MTSSSGVPGNQSASAEDVELRERLRGLREDPPAADFASRLHLRLAESGPPAALGGWPRLRAWLDALPRGLWPAVGGALVAALVVVLAMTAERNTAWVEVPASKIALVRVGLTTDVAVASADMEITLPDGLAFWSHGQALPERTFAWSQPLAAGVNEIPIAIRGQRPGRYHVVLKAHAGSQEMRHDVALRVVDG